MSSNFFVGLESPCIHRAGTARGLDCTIREPPELQTGISQIQPIERALDSLKAQCLLAKALGWHERDIPSH